MNKKETKIDVNEYDSVISLGCCCENTFAIRKLPLNKQKISYPFDWIAIYDVDDICKLIENRFDKFDEVIMTNNIHVDKPIKQLKCVYYDIYFPHHTEMKFNMIFNRKIEVFYNELNSDKKILFLLKCHRYNKCSSQQARRLISILNTFKCKYKLLIINEFDTEDKGVYPNECIVYQIDDVIPCDIRDFTFWKNTFIY